MKKDIISVDRRIQIRRIQNKRKEERRSIHITVTIERRTAVNRRHKIRRMLKDQRIVPDRRHIDTEVLLDRRFTIPLPGGENG